MDPINIGFHYRAMMFASEKHSNQRRKDALLTPYINHPIEVANILIENSVDDPVTLVSALLHDTVEDTNTSLEEISSLFGPEVATIVNLCTDDKSLPKVERKKLQILNSSNQNIDKRAKMVKLADKYSNIKSIISNPPTSWSKERIDGYVLWCYIVCKNMRGIIPSLDSKINEVCSNFKISDSVEPSEIEKGLSLYFEGLNS